MSRLVAYVVPREAQEADAHEGDAKAWRSHLVRRFGTKLPPLTFTTVDRLPRNAGGKVDRRALSPAGTARETAAALTLSDRESDMADLWTEFVDARRFGPGDTFFGSGGHSLQVPQLVHRIRERFGTALTLRDCYEHPTLAGMTALAVARSGSAHRTATP